MFGTSGIRGSFGSDVTAALALDIGRALAVDGASRVVIGRDPRLTGDLLTDALAAGVRECGGDVVDLGLAATPTVARSVAWQDADAGVSVTASHNPPADNGIKLWTPSGMAFDEDRRERISELLAAGAFDPAGWDAVGDRRRWEGARARHASAVGDAVDVSEDLCVVVDVGNGAGGVTVDALRAAGCSVETLNEGPDGRFPARPSEPTPDHCRILRSVVTETGADLGIAHDGDADRMLAVDDSGAFVPGDVLLALFAREAAGSDDRVAAPVNTSLAVDDALAGVGASVVRTRVGDVFVAEHARENDVVFGGEPSGAWIWPAETLCPDGTLAAAKLVALVARRGALSNLAGAIDQYPLRRESRGVDDKAAVMESVGVAADERYDNIDRRDGVRIETGDGWLLVRASGTEPLVRLTAQARDPQRADELLAAGHALVDGAVEE
ncbi:MAG: phosphoglucosamine mutase [Haloarculaceae archaeon]